MGHGQSSPESPESQGARSLAPSIKASPDAVKSLPPIEGLLPGRMRIYNRADDVKPFELWMPERARLTLARPLEGGAELPGFGPGAENFLRRPHGVQ